MSIKINAVNEVNCRISGPINYIKQIQDHFTYFAEGYRFHPKYKVGAWDGKIRSLNMREGNTFPKGLIPDLAEYLSEAGIEFDVDPDVFTTVDYDLSDDDITKLYKSIDAPYQPRDYQIEGVKHAINNGRTILLSPTASGKSYMLYGMARFFVGLGKRVLIIIHRKGLVKQLIDENFVDEYDKNRGSFTSHCIYSGKEKKTDAQIVCSTWHSIVGMPQSFYDQFDVIIGDEVHAWKAKSLITIGQKCVNIADRIGVTGTLDDIESNQVLIKGIFGPPYQLRTTKELMDGGDVADLSIKGVMFDYSEATKKAVRKDYSKYKDEVDFISNHKIRMKILIKMIQSLNGNTLVAFRHTDHGKAIFDALNTNRRKFYIDGKVDVDKRIEHQKQMEKSTNDIGIVSLGTFAEGVNIKNVNYVILACPIKTKIKLLQLIGRGLRLADGKTKVVFIDICDNFSIGKYKNFSLLHAYSRYKRYQQEGFKIEFSTIKLY